MIAPPAVGARWGERFELLEARDGGPGRVTYLARDRAFGSDVELWWIVPGVHRDEAADALVEGAATLRSLVHPAVRTLLDTGFAEGTTWAAYAVASPGVQPRERSPLPLPAVAAWARAVAGGLGAAHQVGWHHGRLVPADVVLVEGAVRVGGLALWMMAEPVSVAAWHTHDAYLAPEVTAGWTVGPPADVWGLAAAVAALASGTERAIEDPGLLAARAPGLAEALAGALVPDPSARVGLAELVGRIDRALAAAGPDAFAPMPSRSVAVPVRPSPAAGVAGAPPVSPVHVPSWSAPPPLAPMPQRPMAPPSAIAPVAPLPPAPVGSGPAAPRLPTPMTGALVPRRATPMTGALVPRRATPTPGALVPRLATPVAGTLAPPPGLLAGVPQAVSLRPGGQRRPTDPRAAIVAPPPEPGPGQPRVVLRPLSELSAVTVAPGEIGFLAPPRELTPPRRRWVPVVGVGLGALTAAAIAIGVATQTGGDEPAEDDGAETPQPTGAGAPAAPSPAPRHLLSPLEPARGCTDETLALGDVCVDPFEAPGRGRVPETGLTARAAADACAARGLRLCTPAEWRAACAGTERAVGEAGACNLGTAAVIVAGGAFERCVSAIEAHDLAGNVAEWVADGTALGASALDGGAGHCDGAPRTAAADAVFPDVGYRCCGDR